jgi:hypothetical protein
MALVGILSTQIILDRFVNSFGKVAHGTLCSRSEEVHHR